MEKSIQVTWNERMKRQGSTSRALPGETAWFTESDVAGLAAAGATCIELHAIRIGEVMPNWNSVSMGFIESYLDNWVKWTVKAGLRCIINICGLATLNPGSYLTMPKWMYYNSGRAKPTNLAEQSEVVLAFWDPDDPSMDDNRLAFANMNRFLVARYGGSPLVDFRPINEPVHHAWQNASDVRLQQIGYGYAKIMDALIGYMEAAGVAGSIYVGMPYLKKMSFIQPLSRHVIWDAHAYISPYSKDIYGWGKIINGYVSKFVLEFGDGLFIGEYGIHPPDYRHQLPDWRVTLANMVSYLDGLPLVGRQWHAHDQLYGEYFASYTQGETDFILDMVVGPAAGPVPEPEPQPEPVVAEIDLRKLLVFLAGMGIVVDVFKKEGE